MQQLAERSRTVCRFCGMAAPRLGSACEHCRRPYTEAAYAIGDAGDTYWVAVRVTFQCSACSFESPLDSLDIDGAITCAHCGLERRFEPTSWRDPIAFAHAVGDLAGPDPEGRRPHPRIFIADRNPHKDVGESTAFGEHRQTGFEEVRGSMVPRALAIWASPGTPVCRRCFVPVGARLPGPGSVVTTCPSCGNTAAYAFADAARVLFPGLIAVVSEEGRVDDQRKMVAMNEQSVAALTCPNCGAPLAVQGRERTVRCQFCSCECRIPPRSMAGAGDLVPEIWWILFGGPSDKRREVEQPQDDGQRALDPAPKRKPSQAKQWAFTLVFVAVALLAGLGVASSGAVQDLMPAPSAATPPAPTSTATARTTPVKRVAPQPARSR